MTKRRDVLWLLSGTATMLLGGCALVRSREAMRYRLLVEVETPEGPRSGSSVIEVRAAKNPDWVNPEGRGMRYGFDGEAVAVDLPDGKTMFALLKSEGGASDAATFPLLAFQDRLRSSTSGIESMRMLQGLIGESAALPRTETTMPNGGTIVSAYPLMVMFKDINDPTTIKRVDPDNLAASFGARYSLKSVTVTITDEPITTGIEKRLGWLIDKNRKRFNPNEKPEGIPLGDFKRLFSTEIK